MDPYKELLETLVQQHGQLRFERFSFEEAHGIGESLVQKAKEENKAITIDIMLGEQQVFHYALAGTSEDNDSWVRRKNRVANHFGTSSYYISILLKSENATIEDKYGLASEDYAPFGGAYPIMLKTGDQVGTITVSGLPDDEDHAMVVEAIAGYLKI